MSLTWVVTESMSFFTSIPPHVNILYEIEGIGRLQEVLSGDMISIRIYDLDSRGALCVFNHIKMREVLRRF